MASGPRDRRQPACPGDDRGCVRRGALRDVKTDGRIKLQMLKELNQVGAGRRRHDLRGPQQAPRRAARGAGRDAHDHRRRRWSAPTTCVASRAGRRGPAGAERRSRRDGNVPADVRARAVGRARQPMPPQMAVAQGPARAAPPYAGHQPPRRPRLPADPDARRRRAGDRARSRRWRPTPSGYVPGAPIIAPSDLHEGLTRLQAGQSGFEVGGAAVPFSGIPAGPAQRPARPAGFAARPEGEPARIDDDRDGRDAVRFHLRHQGPSGRHQGAARAAADPGAQGRDARRRVLREEVPPGAAPGQRARAGGPRLVAGDGAGRSAVPQDRRHRPRGPRPIRRRPRPLRGAARRARGVPRRRGEGGRGQHRSHRRGDQPA